MKEQFVTYEIALVLKELGFNEECFGYFKTDKNLHEFYGSSEQVIDCNIQAPLWQQVIDWLREKHNIYLTIYNPLLYNSYYPDSKYGFDCEIEFLTKNNNVASTLISNNDSGFETYYEVREQAINKAIEIIK